jgi:hypothetical protein
VARRGEDAHDEASLRGEGKSPAQVLMNFRQRAERLDRATQTASIEKVGLLCTWITPRDGEISKF